MGLLASKYEVKKPQICLTCNALMRADLITWYCLEHNERINPCGMCDEYERGVE